ncbi:MAG TPA: hypothetical protein VJ124_00610 [Pyrinomonadaceae bacterium]|nr:hypothetical protein [Pyrinomonadaceae bacterium]
MNNETLLSDCLKTVAEAAAKGEAEIDGLRLALKERESQVRIRIAALVSDVAKVVFASNSQALRQRAVRGLDWGARVKAGIIAEAFGVNEHAIHSIAGPLVEQTPCEGGCGEQVEHTYRSHSDCETEGAIPNGESLVYAVNAKLSTMPWDALSTNSIKRNNGQRL